MDSTREEEIKQEKSRDMSKRSRIIWAVLIFFSLAGMVGYHFFPHLLWKYSERKLGPDLTESARILNRHMPNVDVPEDWAEHSLGCMRFCLPPDMLPKESQAPTIDSLRADFYNNNIGMTIVLDSWESQDFLRKISQMHPNRKCFSTMTQLRLETCGTAADDFRWSMSRKEVIWHTFIVSMRPLLISVCTERTETFSGKNWEGLLCFRRTSDASGIEKESLQFLCECVSCPVTASIIWGTAWGIANEGENFDADIARKIVQSLEIDCCPCPTGDRRAEDEERDAETGGE